MNAILALLSICTRKYCQGVYKCRPSLRGQYDDRRQYFGTDLKNSYCVYSPDMLKTYKRETKL